MSKEELIQHLVSIKDQFQKIINESVNDPYKPLKLDVAHIHCVASEYWVNHLGKSGEYVVIKGVSEEDNPAFVRYLQGKMKSVGLSDQIEIQTFVAHL